VRELVARHHEETGSPVAASLLAIWERARSEFTAVVPRDYRRVLSLMAAAEAAGEDVDTTVMEALRA
jgi:glutamate synthase (NADPH) large chain